MKQNRPLIGISFMIASMAVFAVKDGIAKQLVTYVGPLQLIWMQYAFTFVALALITFPRHGLAAFRPEPVGVQLFRGISALSGVALFYWALSYIPLADTWAMALVAPLVVTALSPFLLGERVGIRRILAVIVGFVGVLVMLRPGFGGSGVGHVIALGSGLMFGCNFLGNRMVAGLHAPLITIAYNVVLSAFLLAPVMPFVWVGPASGDELAWIWFVVLSLLGHGLMVLSFGFGPAPIIAPYQYSAIVFAAIAGYLMFGDFPDNWTWAGVALIIGAGLFIALREKYLVRAHAGERDAMPGGH
jgi:drug/metabolite transporter (DMT)-like permease